MKTEDTLAGHGDAAGMLPYWDAMQPQNSHKTATALSSMACCLTGTACSNKTENVEGYLAS